MTWCAHIAVEFSIQTIIQVDAAHHDVIVDPQLDWVMKLIIQEGGGVW